MSTAPHDGTSVIEQLAAYAAAESFEGLPADAVGAARLAILDTLGVALAGSAEDTAVRARALIAHRGSAEEATILGTPLRECLEDAAFVPENPLTPDELEAKFRDSAGRVVPDVSALARLMRTDAR
jgi:MmgE/PrpD N-terminal domain